MRIAREVPTLRDSLNFRRSSLLSRNEFESGTFTIVLHATSSFTYVSVIYGAKFPFNWILDTGSDADAVGVSQLTALGGFVENLDVDDDEVRGANGTQLRSLGNICATFSTGATQHVSTIHVYEGLDNALLSRVTLQ